MLHTHTHYNHHHHHKVIIVTTTKEFFCFHPTTIIINDGDGDDKRIILFFRIFQKNFSLECKKIFFFSFKTHTVDVVENFGRFQNSSLMCEFLVFLNQKKKFSVTTTTTTM